MFLIKKYNLILQIHGNIEMDFNKQLEYLKILEKYSDYLGYSIILTFHPIYDQDEVASVSKTIEYLSNLTNKIDSNKVIVCLENLNDTREFTRLEKKKIRQIILNDEKIYFTYNIGHEIADYGKITDLDQYMIEDIRNIHIHSNDNKGNDHKPIYRDDIHWNKIIKSLIFLLQKNYQYNIVYEYNLYDCHGSTEEEKLFDYLKSIDYVSERYGSNPNE